MLRAIVDAAPTAAPDPGTLSSFLLAGSSTVLHQQLARHSGLSNHLNLSAGLYFRF